MWTLRRNSCAVNMPNQRSTWLIQDEPVGVKWTCKRGCSGGGQALIGADHDGLSDELGQGREHVEDLTAHPAFVRQLPGGGVRASVGESGQP